MKIKKKKYILPVSINENNQKRVTIPKEKNTTIMISESTWKVLMAMKSVGETFDEVIMRLIKNDK